MRETPDQIRQITAEFFKQGDMGVYQRAYNFWGNGDSRSAFIETAIGWTVGSLHNKVILDEATRQIGLSTREGFPEIIARLPDAIMKHVRKTLAQADAAYLRDVVNVMHRIPGLTKDLPDAVRQGYMACGGNKNRSDFFMNDFLKTMACHPEYLDGIEGQYFSQPTLPTPKYGRPVVVFNQKPDQYNRHIHIYTLDGSPTTPLDLREKWSKSVQPKHQAAMTTALTAHFDAVANGTVQAPNWVKPLAIKAFSPPPAPPKRRGWDD